MMEDVGIVMELANQNQGNDVVLAVTLSVDLVRVMALPELVNSYNMASSIIQEVFDELEELKQALFKYGTHDVDCDIFYSEPYNNAPCTCGLESLQEKYKKKPDDNAGRLPYGMVVAGKTIELK